MVMSRHHIALAFWLPFWLPFWLALWAGALAGCTVLSPPPMIPAHEAAQPLPEGSVSVTLIGALGGGVFLDDSLGMALQIGYQSRADTAVGVNLGVGRRFDERDKPDRLQWLFPLRVFARWNPSELRPWWAVTFGVGGGYGDSGLSYLTFDGGVGVSTGTGTFDGYAQATGALSIPLSGPPVDDREVRTTIYGGLSLGVIANSDGAFGGSMDLTVMDGLSRADHGVLALVSSAMAYRRPGNTTEETVE